MKRPGDTDRPAGPDPGHDLVQRFSDRWDLALRGGTRPSVEDFLGQVSEAERGGLRPLLEQGGLAYVRRNGNGPAVEATVDLPPQAAADTRRDLGPTLDSS